MAEAPRPFRPKGDPSPAAPLVAVREQLAQVRRRANVYAMQQALYTGGTVVLTAFGALVLLAFALSRNTFALAVWLIFSGLVVVLARLLASGRRNWIPARDAALTIDGRTTLADRLATLAANEEAERHSRLWGTLVNQNLRLLPRWTPALVVPRLVPLSVWAFGLALLAVLLVLRWSDEAARTLGRGEQSTPPPPEASEIRAGGETAGDGAVVPDSEDSLLASLLTALPDRLRETILGAETRPGGAGATRLARLPDGVMPPGAGGLQPGQGAPDRVDPSMLPPVSGEGKGKGKPREGARASGEGQEERVKGDTREPAHGDRPKTLPRVESGKPRPGDVSDRKAAEGGGGPGAGSGTGGDADRLYGKAEGGRQASGTFELDLAGRAAEGPRTREEEENRGARPAAELAAEQRLDDAIRRAQVPPEYERIVQRLFHRSDEPAETGNAVGAR